MVDRKFNRIMTILINIFTFIPAGRRMRRSFFFLFTALSGVCVKTVSNSSQGHDMLCVVPQASAKQLDMGVKSAVIAVVIIAPHLADKLFAGQRHISVFDKIEE